MVFKLEDVVKSSLRKLVAVWIFLLIQCSDGNGFLECLGVGDMHRFLSNGERFRSKLFCLTVSSQNPIQVYISSCRWLCVL